ncbi:MAG: hypothetical protein WD875_15355 [Pirellulales bacterium]
MKEPLVSIALKAYTRIFAPGDELAADFQIDAVEPDEVQAVEASVLWYTEGKGDEDLGVHFFKRFDGDEDSVPLHELRSIGTTLPYSPLSYDGRIVKVRWCVRVRAFLDRGRFVVADQWFQLGSVASPSQCIGEVGNGAAIDKASGTANGRHASGDATHRNGNSPSASARRDDGERESTLAAF